MQNTALLRRRIRDPHLTLENHKVGGRSRTDVVLAYMDNQVNQAELEELRGKLDRIDVAATPSGRIRLRRVLWRGILSFL